MAASQGQIEQVTSQDTNFLQNVTSNIQGNIQWSFFAVSCMAIGSMGLKFYHLYMENRKAQEINCARNTFLEKIEGIHGLHSKIEEQIEILDENCESHFVSHSKEARKFIRESKEKRTFLNKHFSNIEEKLKHMDFDDPKYNETLKLYLELGKYCNLSTKGSLETMYRMFQTNHKQRSHLYKNKQPATERSIFKLENEIMDQIELITNDYDKATKYSQEISRFINELSSIGVKFLIVNPGIIASIAGLYVSAGVFGKLSGDLGGAYKKVRATLHNYMESVNQTIENHTYKKNIIGKELYDEYNRMSV